jgi:hypothetical protein
MAPNSAQLAFSVMRVSVSGAAPKRWRDEPALAAQPFEVAL